MLISHINASFYFRVQSVDISGKTNTEEQDFFTLH